MIKIIQKENIHFITLQNHKGMELTLCTLGASVYELKVPDKKGNSESVVVTPESLSDFYQTDAYYGKSVGRYAGRIDHARCVIENKTYTLEKNWNGLNALHGGYRGLSFQLFAFTTKEREDEDVVVFNYLEKEDLLPGNLQVTITYRLCREKNEYRIDFEANTDKTTLCNLTNHAYFNLSGNLKRNILQQTLQLNCNRYTRVNDELITLSIDPVNPVMDFTIAHPIGDHIADDSLQKHPAAGYDHCFLKSNEDEPLIAIYQDEESGRKLSVYTDYPSIVVYCNNYPKEFAFRHKSKLEKHDAICLECQYVPNGINMEQVNQGLLKPGENFHHYIRYCFE